MAAALPARGASDTTPAGALLTVVGGVLVAIGTVLPWTTVSTPFVSLSRNGFQLGTNGSMTFDGPVCVLLAVIAIVIGVTRITASSMPRFMQRSSIVVGIVVGLVLADRWPGLHDYVNQFGSRVVTASIGYGFWLCALGALVTVIGGIVLRQKSSRR
ncbi:MAG: hypothetical protein ACRDZR_01155 [Acidimicrobiales bacterium]